MCSNAHWSQQYTTQLQNGKPTTYSNRRTTRAINHPIQRPQVAGTNRKKSVRLQTEYEDSLPATSTTNLQNPCSHSTSPLSDLTWNMQSSSGHHIYVETLIKYKECKEKLQKWFQRYETIATNNGSRTWNSLASCTGEFEGNFLRCSNISTDQQY